MAQNDTTVILGKRRTPEGAIWQPKVGFSRICWLLYHLFYIFKALQKLWTETFFQEWIFSRIIFSLGFIEGDFTKKTSFRACKSVTCCHALSFLTISIFDQNYFTISVLDKPRRLVKKCTKTDKGSFQKKSCFLDVKRIP